MGILRIPSLEEKRSIVIENISQSEAEYFILDFEGRVRTNRSLKAQNDSVVDSFITYRLLEDLYSYDVVDIIDTLVISETPGARGLRAVFIEEEDDTILVGTTVVYSRNWAAVGVNDKSLAQTILDMQY